MDVVPLLQVLNGWPITEHFKNLNLGDNNQTVESGEYKLYTPSVRERFAQGHPEQVINPLRSFITPSKQLMNTLLRPLHDPATLDPRFAHDIACQTQRSLR